MHGVTMKIIKRIIIFMSRVHRFSKNVGASSKFYVSDM